MEKAEVLTEFLYWLEEQGFLLKRNNEEASIPAYVLYELSRDFLGSQAHEPWI